MYRLSIKNRPDFGDVLKIFKFFQVLRVSCALEESKFLSTFLGYLMGHRWGVPTVLTYKKLTPWPQFPNELYRPSDRRLSETLVPTFAKSGCHVVSLTDP
jgi:hypothetical protein